MKRIHPKASAFTLLEVLVIATLVAILLFMLVEMAPPTKREKEKARHIQCRNNLKNIALGLQTDATDHNDRPIRTNDVVAFVSAFTNQIAFTRVFYCPSDKTRSAATNWATLSTGNISYFFNVAVDETNPQAIMAGDSDLEVNGKPLATGRNIVPMDAKVSWSSTRHNSQSVILMGDGSVQQLSIPRLQQAFSNTGVTNDMILLAP